MFFVVTRSVGDGGDNLGAGGGSRKYDILVRVLDFELRIQGY